MSVGNGGFVIPGKEESEKFAKFIVKQRQIRSTWHFKLRYRLWLFIGKLLGMDF